MPTFKHSKAGANWLFFLRLEGRLAESPAGRRLWPTRAKILTLLPGTADALAVFGGPHKAAGTFIVFGSLRKNGRYVYGFQRPKKDGRYVYCFQNNAHL